MVKSLGKIVKQEALKNIYNDVISDYGPIKNNPNNVKLSVVDDAIRFVSSNGSNNNHKSFSSSGDDKEESKEPDYDENRDQPEEEQEEEADETTTNQVF